MKAINLMIVALLFSGAVAGQNGSGERFWGSNYYNGEIGLSTFLKNQDRSSLGISENQSVKNYGIGLLLNTQNYFWSPKFLLVDISAAYNPVGEQNLFLVSPDRNEVRTLKKLDIRGTFLREKKISLSGFINVHENFIKRDIVTDVRLRGRSFGGIASLKGKMLPMNIEYQENEWTQLETEINRQSSNLRKFFRARTDKSFTRWDRTELNYSHNDTKFGAFEGTIVQNVNDIIDLSNDIFLDTLHDQRLKTKFVYTDQKGNQKFTRTFLSNNANINLAKEFRFFGSLQYMNFQRPTSTLDMYVTQARFTHKLYASLNSEIYYWFSQNNQTSNRDTNQRVGGSIRYTKKIPTGVLNLSYGFYRLHQEVDQISSVSQVNDEDVILADNQVTLLKNPFINLSSILVKDPSGLINYILNIDYILFERDNFIEIQRIPGGQIVNGSLVLVDYIFERNFDFALNLNNHILGANVTVLDKLLDFYARLGKQSYSNVESTNEVIVKPFDDLALGSSINYKSFKGGADYQSFQSNITPFKMFGIHAQLTGKLFNKVQYSLIANRRKYNRISANRKQIFIDVNGGVTYLITSKSKLDLNIGFREQQGREIDLSLLNARAELSTSFRLIHIRLGGGLYKRSFLTEIVDYNNFYFQIMRKF